MFHWNNIETTYELLNGHGNHEAGKQFGNAAVFKVPIIMTLRLDSVVEAQFPEIASELPTD